MRNMLFSVAVFFYFIIFVSKRLVSDFWIKCNKM